jgi:hypothetical protein
MRDMWQNLRSNARPWKKPEILFTGMLPQGTTLYDIEVEEDHSFVIEGIVAHNSACRVRCKCWAWVTDNGDGTGIYHWRLAAIEAERHCADCKGREGDHVVYRRPIIERVEERRVVG